jgi:hypothetical protein
MVDDRLTMLNQPAEPGQPPRTEHGRSVTIAFTLGIRFRSRDSLGRVPIGGGKCAARTLEHLYGGAHVRKSS